MNINKHIIDTKTEILKVINQANLPIAVIELIVSDILNQVRIQLSLSLQVEKQIKDNPKEGYDGNDTQAGEQG